MTIDARCRKTLTWLEMNQEREDGLNCRRGEFPMTLRCPGPRTDYNYLTGYALLHLACCRSLLADRLSAEALRIMETILGRATDVPAAYQTCRGSTNWYHGRLSGDHFPPDVDWPDGIQLGIHDDLDDTAISTMLVGLYARFKPLRMVHPSLFTRWLYDPRRDVLRTKAVRRLQFTGVLENVFMTWVMVPDGDYRAPVRKTVRIPTENSIELVTAANIWAALKMLAGTEQLPGMTETREFVNRLTRLALHKLVVEDDPSFLEFCAPYYPRVPFAPLSFLLRAHALSGKALLEGDTANRIVDAVRSVEPSRHSRPTMQADFAALAYWLNAAGWCARLDLQPAEWLGSRAVPRLEKLAADHLDVTGSWPDFVFFLGAHLGDYSGPAYSNCMMVETMALLLQP